MGVRARIIDRLTDAVRAPREVVRLRAECERLRKARDLNRSARETSNAGNEAFRRDLSALLTGDSAPLSREDMVARVQAVIDERDKWKDEALRAHDGWEYSSDLLDAEITECEARIPVDVDGAQAWAEAAGVFVRRRGDAWQVWRSLGSHEVHIMTGDHQQAVARAVACALDVMWACQ